MEKDYTTMDFDKISEVITEWNSIISSFEGSIKKAKENAGYTAIVSANLDNGFVNDYDSNIDLLISSLKSSVSQLQSVLIEMGDLDDDITKKSPAKTKTPPEDSEMSHKLSPTTKNLIDNSKEQLEAYKTMSMNDLDSVSKDLAKYAKEQGKTVEEILSNKEYSQQIKELLLQNKNLSQELKQMITDGSSEISQAVIKSIFDGKQSEIIGLTDNTVITMKAYLTAVAQTNGITLDELINNQEHSVLLKSSLKSFDGVAKELTGLTEDSIVDRISKIYDGNGVSEIDENTIGIIRGHIDVVASSSQTSAEEVLFGDTLNSEINNLGKFSIFAENLYGYEDESIVSILKNIVK